MKASGVFHYVPVYAHISHNKHYRGTRHTDAMRSQIHLFENPTGSRTEVKELEISTFAAGRDSISKQVFKASSIGGFASDTIKELMAETDPEQLAQAISKIGPGYQRFRLQEQLYALLEKNDRIKG